MGMLEGLLENPADETPGRHSPELETSLSAPYWPLPTPHSRFIRAPSPRVLRRRASDTSYSGVVAVMLDDLPAAELRFHFKSGRLCLDFVATVGERWRRCFERLRTPADLGRWLVEASLLSSDPPVEQNQLDDARRLRESIYRIAWLARRGSPDRRDVRELNRWAGKPPLAPRLADDGRTVTWVADRAVPAALATIARDAADLLSGPLATRVRECAAPDCALLFVDSSRPGRRRWCSMDACGNRTKTAAYRSRRSAGAGKEP
jgi:predicted RNA-binding Zn ribbon-like protein